MAPADRLLAALAPDLASPRPVEFEFSLRLRPGRIENSGRFAIWRGGSADDRRSVGRALARLGAPDEVVRAQAIVADPIRQGVSVGLIDDTPEFRLYLHDRAGTPRRDRSRAWRWRDGSAVTMSDYGFHFLPETAAGERPRDLAPAVLRPALDTLLADDRLRALSGFWLRRGVDGRPEQIYVTFPWMPDVCSLAGVAALTRLLQISEDEFAPWRDLPVRHVGIACGEGPPAVTLYVSAKIAQWPQSETAMQDAVRTAAGAARAEIEHVIVALPPVPAAEPSSRGAWLDRFYSGDIGLWRRVIGEDMHYHHGLFDSDALADDAAMAVALRRAVTDLYPFIARGSTLYDIGCGWGAPLDMFARDLDCDVLGLTVSATQFRHVAARGLPVRWGDAETTWPPHGFDCAVMIESLCHIEDRARLLKLLRRFCGRLVMRTNCQDAPATRAFAGTMPMISSQELRGLLKAAGWRIVHWRDRRCEAMPSVAVWHRRVATLPHGRDPQIDAVRDWCANVLADPVAWAGHHPLIEVVCE